MTLNEPASVSMVFTQSVTGRKVSGKCVSQTRRNRHRRACKRTLVRGGLTFTGHPGANRVAFQGLLSRSNKLAPGTYTVVITATAAGMVSVPSMLTFTVARK